MASVNPSWWAAFLAELAAKTRTKAKNPQKLVAALKNAVNRPAIYLAFGIHGNILFPDAGYCEFDDPDRAWEHLQRWATVAGLWAKGPAKVDGGFPVGFEVGIVSLEELAKMYPVWTLLKENCAEIINPLYSQPYLRHVGEESNVRQFEYGLKVLSEHNLSVDVFASSEHALHPQLPQLLRAFGISCAHASARLAGGAPTSYDPKVKWIGADGTAINTIASQSGLLNGHVWHGAFFEELPGLIFAAVARPDLSNVVYVNIEDFANPMPGSQDIIAHLPEFERGHIYFRSFRHIVANTEKMPVSRQVHWTLDDFPIRLMNSKLIAASRKCEDFLVAVEAVDTLLSTMGSKTHELSLQDAWRKLLVGQNHDAFVVPFTTPGMYSTMQGIPLTKQWAVTESIEDRCVRNIQEAEDTGRQVLDDLDCGPVMQMGRGIASKTADQDREVSKVAMLNMLWARSELVQGQLYDLPPLGYSTRGKPPPDLRSFTIKDNTLLVEDTRIGFNEPFTHSSHPGSLKLTGTDWAADVTDHVSRVELVINTTQPLEISLELKGKVYITYPFGAEPTALTQGHSLRFMWDDGGIVMAHSGAPYFRRGQNQYKHLILPGTHAFAVAPAKTLVDAYRRAWEFFYPPIPFRPPNAPVSSGRFCHVEFNGCVPTSLRVLNKQPILRLLSVDGSKPKIVGAKAVDFQGKIKAVEAVPWRILNYRLHLVPPH